MLMATAFWIRFFIAQKPIEQLLTYTADDMFYYLKIAANLVFHGTPSFDGESLTNGFHPLYTFLLMLGMAVFDDPVLRIRMALALLAFADLVAIVFIVKIFGKLNSPGAGWIVAAIWVFNPFVTSLTVTGMECSLVSATLAFACYCFVALFKEPDKKKIQKEFSLASRLDCFFWPEPTRFGFAYGSLALWE